MWMTKKGELYLAKCIFSPIPLEDNDLLKSQSLGRLGGSVVKHLAVLGPFGMPLKN